MRKKDKLSKLVNNPSFDNFVITYDRNERASASDDIQKYTFLHELLHAFGFDDVYNATAMHGYINDFVLMKDFESDKYIFYNLSSNDKVNLQKVIQSEEQQEIAPEMQ